MGVFIKKHQQTGFTLIEALIALVVVAIGLVGAAMFQSQLVGESGNSKAKMVATKLAEDTLEEQRALLLRAQYNAMAASAASVSVGNYTYNVSYTVTDQSAAASAATGFQAHKLIDVTVSWVDPRGDNESVSLSALQVWSDPNESLDDQSSAGSPGGVGIVSRPEGAAQAIAREEIGLNTNVDVGDWVNVGGKQYGIKTGECDNGDCIDGKDVVTKVIELTDGSSSPIFSVKGKIFFDPVNIPTIANIATLKAQPNVLTTEGGGCAVYTDSDGDGAYTCLFGEGWYGTIAIVLADEAKDIEDSVCLAPRSYRYYIVNAASVAAGSTYDSSIVGQSGLVRYSTLGGNGPLLAPASAASTTANLGYYFVDPQVLQSTITNDIFDASNVTGNVVNQHFVITSLKSNSGFELIENCVRSPTGKKKDKQPLNGTIPYTYESSLHASDPASLKPVDYWYDKDDDGVVETDIPNTDVILGYVNSAFELSGIVDLSAVSGDFTGASTAAESLLDHVIVGIDPLPDYTQDCILDSDGDGLTISYACFVQYGYSPLNQASVEATVSSATYSYIIQAPASHAITTVTESKQVGNFTLCPAVGC